MASDSSTLRVGIPRPSAPNPTTNQTLQNVSFYKSLRSLTDMLNAQQTGSIKTSFGTVATTASDGTPATFTQGGLDALLIRVFGAGSPIAPVGAAMWVAGGGETQVRHGLGRVPIGYWVVRNRLGAMISDGDSAWDSTYIYFHTDHSDSDIILMVF